MDWNNTDSLDHVESKPSFQARIGMQSFATMVRYFEDNNIPYSSRSDIVRKTFEMMVVALTRGGSAEAFSTQHEAFDYLKRRDLAPTNRARDEKAATKALEQEDELLEKVGHEEEEVDIPEGALDHFHQTQREMKKQEREEENKEENEESEKPPIGGHDLDALEDNPNLIRTDESEDD